MLVDSSTHTTPHILIKSEITEALKSENSTISQLHLKSVGLEVQESKCPGDLVSEAQTSGHKEMLQVPSESQDREFVTLNADEKVFTIDVPPGPLGILVGINNQRQLYITRILPNCSIRDKIKEQDIIKYLNEQEIRGDPLLFSNELMISSDRENRKLSILRLDG